MARVEPGMLCTVIGGTDGLNLGKRVVARQIDGEHSKLGTIWLCTAAPGTSIVTEYGGVGISAHFAADWLEPYRPPPVAREQALLREARVG